MTVNQWRMLTILVLAHNFSSLAQKDMKALLTIAQRSLGGTSSLFDICELSLRCLRDTAN